MKRNSQASGHGQSPSRETPVGGFAQPDERDESAESRPVIDRKVLGPRRVIQQAARDIARGLKDTDQHGTPTNVPGPVSQQAAARPLVAQGGDRQSYADDQQDSAPKPPADGSAPPKTG